jgi:hypothetical protein
MPTGAEQAAIIRDLATQGRYADAYRYVANQVISGNSSWDQRLVDFFETAADVNQPQSNFWKEWIFTSNALAAGLDPNDPGVWQHNQNVSDGLARALLSDVADALDAGQVVTPAEIYTEDLIPGTQYSTNYQFRGHNTQLPFGW